MLVRELGICTKSKNEQKKSLDVCKIGLLDYEYLVDGLLLIHS